MRAVVITEPGPPESLRVQTVPDPQPGPDEVLVDIVSSALNRADLLQRRGMYPGPPAEFDIPGMEFAGRVTAMGERVTAHHIGEEVMGITAGWAHAERLAVHERLAIAIPNGVLVADAGAIPEVFMTAWDALVVQGGLTSGRVALVHAGGSGVGTAAIQIARAIGATVIVTAASGKVTACRELGAAEAVDYRTSDFVQACQSLTGGRGVDVVVDVVGGDYLDRNVDAVRVGGRIIQVGVMGGGRTSFSLGKLLPKRVSLIGTVLRSRPIEDKIALSQRFASEIVPLFASGQLHPVIDSRYPMSEIAAAHAHMEANANFGKIVIDVA